MTHTTRIRPPRRRIAALAGLAAWALAPQAMAEETLRAVIAFPSALAFSQSFMDYVDAVNAEGDGVVRIEVAGGPEVIPQNQQIDALRRGVVDMQYGPASFWLGKMPEADAWVGGTVTAMEARENGGFDIMQDVFREKLGVHLLAHTETGQQFYIYTIEEPPRTADGGVDLANLKLRSQPIYKSFFESLGTVPISVPVPEVYTGLERNVFDGAGWPIIGARDLSWDRFLKHRIDPGFFGMDLAISVNADVWEGLDAEAKDLLTRLAIEHERGSHDKLKALAEETEAAMLEDGLSIVELEGDVADAYLDAAYDAAWGRLRESGSEHYDALRDAYYAR